MRRDTTVRLGLVVFIYWRAVWIVVLCLPVSGSCSTSTMELSWAPPDSHALRKIIVVEVAREESLRRAYEDTLSQVISQVGLATIPSHKILGANGEIEEERAVNVMREAGFRGVFITRLIRLTKNTETVPTIPPSWGAPIGPAWGPTRPTGARLSTTHLG